MSKGHSRGASGSVLLLLLSLMSHFYLPVSSSPSLYTNEVVQGPEGNTRPRPDLPPCTPASVCGYLQANSRGINVQHRCVCQSGTCPMSWDGADGHSVSHGSDQYKFCDPPPQLQVCGSGVTAYSSRLVFSKETEQFLMKSDHIHCICPENHTHVLIHQKFGDSEEDEELEWMELRYVCEPLKPCQRGDFCKTVSETLDEFLVQSKCRCGEGLRCPTDAITSVAASGSVMSTLMGNGVVRFIRCQP